MAKEGASLPIGLRNLGYTCYINTVLQALSSCQSVIAQFQDALCPPGAASRAAPPLPPAAVAAPLAAATLDCLLRLQPQPDGSSSSMVSFAPRALLDLFRSKLPPGVLEAGEEHDAAEAWECLCGLLAEELQAAFAHSGTQRQLLGRASLAAVLELRGSGGTFDGGGRGGGFIGCLPMSVQGAPLLAGHACTSPAACQGISQPVDVDIWGDLKYKDSSSGSRAGSDGEGRNCGVETAPEAAAGGTSAEQPAASSAPPVAVQAACIAGEAIAANTAGPAQAAGAGKGAAAEDAAGALHAAAAEGTAQAAGTVDAAGEAEAAGTAAFAARPAGTAEAAGAAWAAVGDLPPDPVLAGWRHLARLPVQGSNAQELQCLRCGHRSCLQLCPFLLLPLGIPTLPQHTLLGSVPAAPGADLAVCLANFYGYEALQGVHCTRCSLEGSLEGHQAPLAATAHAGSTAQEPDAAADGAAAAEAGRDVSHAAGSACQVEVDGQDAAGGSTAPGARHGQGMQRDVAAGAEGAEAAAQLQRLQLGLADRGSLLLESEAYPGLLHKAGLPWVPRPSPAARRTVLASLPRVLCLQLRRGFWSQHGHVKVSGHVTFPLTLVLPRDRVPRLGSQREQEGAWQATHGETAALGSTAARHGSSEASMPPPRPPLFMLRAVVVHHGGLAGGGHYTVYRCLDGTAHQAASPMLRSRWVGVSDEDVRLVGVREVLAAEASMLVYERR